MKATGIVRRIDDLGRVVIPKEIRRTMRIREGDPLEIYTSNDGEVIFKKYSAIGEMANNATQIAEVVNRLVNTPIVVFDRDHVIAVSGVQKKEFNERRLSPDLEDILENRKPYFFTDPNQPRILPVEGVDRNAIACVPIISAGDITGAVALLGQNSESTVNDEQKLISQAAAQFLGKQVEE